jgi:hypothetical protein
MKLVIIIGVILGILSYLLLFNKSEQRIMTEEDVGYLFSDYLQDNIENTGDLLQVYEEKVDLTNGIPYKVDLTNGIPYKVDLTNGIPHKVLPALYFELEPDTAGVEINNNCFCKTEFDDFDEVTAQSCNCLEYPTITSGTGQLKLTATFPSGTKNVKLIASPSRSYLTQLSNITVRGSQTMEMLNINYNLTNVTAPANENVQETSILLYLNNSDEPSVKLPLLVELPASPSITLTSFTPADLADIDDVNIPTSLFSSALTGNTPVNIIVDTWDSRPMCRRTLSSCATSGTITFTVTFPVGTTSVQLKTNPSRSWLPNVSTTVISTETTKQITMNYNLQGENSPSQITDINLHLNGSSTQVPNATIVLATCGSLTCGF